MSDDCLFCGSTLGEETKDQHIIPKGVGGSLRTDQVTCSACNETFGDTIDLDFAQKYQWLLVHLPPELVQGYSPPKLLATNEKGEQISILPGYRPEDRHFAIKFAKPKHYLIISLVF